MLPGLASGTFIPQLTFLMGRGHEWPKMSEVHLSSAARFRTAINSSGRSNFLKSDGRGRPSTFKVPAYDPVPIAVMGAHLWWRLWLLLFDAPCRFPPPWTIEENNNACFIVREPHRAVSMSKIEEK